MRPEELTPPQLADFIDAFTDHETFCRESLSIRNTDGISVPFSTWPSGRKMNAALEKQIRRGKPVRLVVLKTRRSGFTVSVTAEFFHRIPFLPGQKGLIIADRYNPAGLEAFDYLLQYQKTYKPFKRHGAAIKLPKVVKDTEGQIKWANDSGVTVLSAEKGDVGRGGGFRFVLADEAAFWRAPELTLTGILNTVPDREGTVVIVQSTANGVGGEFYDLWQRANDPAQGAGWVPVFFGWLENPLCVRTVEGDLFRFQQSLDDEERLLMELHGATLENLAWRRWKIATACRGKVEEFHQEYPTTPEEAFLSSGRPALDHQALSRMPVQQPSMVGELESIDEIGGKRIILNAKEYGAVQMWRRPEPGRMYVMGGDPARGIDVSESKRGDDPDWSVGIVLDRESGEQVAMVRERLRPSKFARYTYLLGRWYNWAFVVPESNAHGLGYIEELIRLGYPVERIYRRQRDPSDRRAGRIDELGFETTEVSRPWLINALDSAIREQAISIRSAIALQECRTFVIKPNGKMEHQTGCHDDCVFGLGLAVMGLRQAPRRGSQATDPARRGRFQVYGTKADRHAED